MTRQIRQTGFRPRGIRGGVIAPIGFLGGSTAVGIKSGKPDRDDLALVVSATRAVSAATFTTNAVKAAPVRLSMEHMSSPGHRVVVLNSGNANACNGAQGLEAAKAMAEAVAIRVACRPREVLVCSTGRIGVVFPTNAVANGLQSMRLGRSDGEDLARAIMTSDTFPKQISFLVSEKGRTFRVGGMAKGAGMIDPNMATMLCVLTTDAVCRRPELRKALRSAVDASFNRITVDGDMSTNDTVIALANGASETAPSADLLTEALTHACRHLAREIVRDGESTTRVIEVAVSGARSADDARKAARAVANSTLTKCAWAGGDPNWGRIVDALGYSGARVEEGRIGIDYDKVPLVRAGCLQPRAWKRARAVAAKKEFRIGIDLGLGPGSHEIWTTDLTEGYVRYNLGE